ncbi:MAG UNVERIFIED_CONTAM: redoxin family protein [Planctomycetaceae bacterium]
MPLHPADKRIGRFIPDYSFKDLADRPHKLSDFSRSRLLVVAMTSTSCPLSRKYLPTLAELTRRFANQSVSFILVNCVSSDEPAAMQQAVATLQPGTIYTADANERLAQHIAAATTTEVVLLDSAELCCTRVPWMTNTASDPHWTNRVTHFLPKPSLRLSETKALL